MNKKKWPHIITVLEIFLILIGVALLLTRAHPPFPGPGAPLQIIYRPLVTHEEIIPLAGPGVPPIAYTEAVPLAHLPTKLKKKKFLDLVLPAILISKYRLAGERQRVAEYLSKKKLSREEESWLNGQMKKFQARTREELLHKMATHPTSIILAQAAIETGWGESRFFQGENNIFGVWSFDPADSRVKTARTRGGKEIYVKKYQSFIESVDDYFLTIARGPYKEFRQARLTDKTPERMVNHLIYYSEQRQTYVRRLQEVIRHNNLTQFDGYQLDPTIFPENDRPGDGS